jgi:hypothetical protein
MTPEEIEEQEALALAMQDMGDEGIDMIGFH